MLPGQRRPVGHELARGALEDDPTAVVPSLWFQGTDSTASDRQRFHLDISVPPEIATPRISAALAAGGTLVSDDEAPSFVVLADADGNKVCVCTALGRD